MLVQSQWCVLRKDGEPGFVLNFRFLEWLFSCNAMFDDDQGDCERR
jgi:hypothetical protein